MRRNEAPAVAPPSGDDLMRDVVGLLDRLIEMRALDVRRLDASLYRGRLKLCVLSRYLATASGAVPRGAGELNDEVIGLVDRLVAMRGFDEARFNTRFLSKGVCVQALSDFRDKRGGQ